MSRLDHRTATPAELLAGKLVLTPTETAYVLGLVFTRGRQAGEPDRRRVLELVDTGRLRPVDPAQPFPRWTFSVEAVRRYLEAPPAGLHLRSAS